MARAAGRRDAAAALLDLLDFVFKPRDASPIRRRSASICVSPGPPDEPEAAALALEMGP